MEKRIQLKQRFEESQKYVQTDPWKERAEGVDSHEFTPLTLSVS
jgi:hypothetical protein